MTEDIITSGFCFAVALVASVAYVRQVRFAEQVGWGRADTAFATVCGALLAILWAAAGFLAGPVQ